MGRQVRVGGRTCCRTFRRGSAPHRAVSPATFCSAGGKSVWAWAMMSVVQIELVMGDIIAERVDAIVNAANS
jgi:hypothetical protein